MVQYVNHSLIDFELIMKPRGFTLVELMIVVAIAAIVLVFGVPSFQEAIRQNRLTTYTNEFITALNLARSEALKRRQAVRLCKSTDSRTCAASGGFEQGWIIYVDVSGGNACNPGSLSCIRVYGSLPEGMTLVGDSDVANRLIYSADGFARKDSINPIGASKWTLCKDKKAREIEISVVGRTTVKTNPTSPSCP